MGALLSACSRGSGDVVPLSGADTTAAYIKSNGLSSKIVRYASGGFSMTLTPNYSKGFGTINFLCAPVCGSDARAIPGPGARLGGGTIDFGNIEQGEDYLYKNALQVSLKAPSGWYLFADTGSDFSAGVPATALVWMVSNAANDATKAGTPFATSSATDGWPFPIASGKAGTTKINYDYVFRVPWAIPTGELTDTVSYTVVPS
jgi:hypothetical protein